MTEAETIAAMTDIGEIAATYISVWLSMTFAYLTTAYFLGKAMSQFQCLVISVLYGTMALFFAVAAMGYAESWLILKARAHTVFYEVWVFNELPFSTATSTVTALFLIGGVLVTLYFMYNVRQAEKS